MIRFGIKFDESDYEKVFLSELSKYYTLVDCDDSRDCVLYFRLICTDAFHAYLLIGEMRTILRNLGYDKFANIYLVTFCDVLD